MDDSSKKLLEKYIGRKVSVIGTEGVILRTVGEFCGVSGDDSGLFSQKFPEGTTHLIHYSLIILPVV